MNACKSESHSNGGIGFLGLLGIVFIVLKLVGIINWSWIWVLAPIWVPATLIISILLGAAIFVIKKGIV